jgi:hypothetical protein
MFHCFGLVEGVDVTRLGIDGQPVRTAVDLDDIDDLIVAQCSEAVRTHLDR